MHKTAETLNTRAYQINMNYIDFTNRKTGAVSEKVNHLETETSKRVSNWKHTKAQRFKYDQGGKTETKDENKKQPKTNLAYFVNNAYGVEKLDYDPRYIEETGQPDDSGTPDPQVDEGDAGDAGTVNPYSWALERSKAIASLPSYVNLEPDPIIVQDQQTGIYHMHSPTPQSGIRGFRNNNWLNIRISNNAWQGKVQNNTDGTFEQFETPELGIRAAAKNIKTYSSRGLNTVRQIISTWAPPNENHTNSYVKNVADRMGVSPDETINVFDNETMVKLIAAMTISENGKEGDIEIIRRGVAMS